MSHLSASDTRQETRTSGLALFKLARLTRFISDFLSQVSYIEKNAALLYVLTLV